MKKAFLTIVPVLGLVAMTMSMSSCSSDCCSLLTVKVCEDDFDTASAGSWEEYKDILEASGYSCD